jgi:hypothetical protein
MARLGTAAAAVSLGVLPLATFGATPGLAITGNCYAAQLAGSGGFLGSFKTVCQVASTVPPRGDVNPYGVAVVPQTVGNLVAGDVLVSNFNNSKNLQGTGTTIMQISPAGAVSVFANLAKQTTDRVGLTTALAVFNNGDVIVGSLPTTDGTAATATRGALYVLNSVGHLIETIKGTDINGPWDMAAIGAGSIAELFVTNVLNGTVAAGGSVVNKGTLVRIVLCMSESPPVVLQRQVIARGFGERTDPNALVIGPTGVAVGGNGTVYVNDTLANRIAAIPNGTTRSTSDGTGKTVTSGDFLMGPLGLTLAPNGDLLSTNGGNGQMVETTPAGDQIEWPSLDFSGSPPGAGALFGLAVKANAKGVYFVDDATNTLDIFK